MVFNPNENQSITSFQFSLIPQLYTIQIQKYTKKIKIAKITKLNFFSNFVITSKCSRMFNMKFVLN